MAVRRRVAIRVGSLVLDGVPARHRHRVGDAFTEELSRLVASLGPPADVAGAPQRLGDRPVDVAVPAGASPETMGRRLAQRLYASLDGRAARP